MSNKVPPRDLTRNLLKQFLPNERAIRAFEQLFQNSNTLIPQDVADINAAIDALSILIADTSLTSLTAESKIGVALSLIKSVSDDLDYLLAVPQKPAVLDDLEYLLWAPPRPLVVDDTQTWVPTFGGSGGQSGQVYATQTGKILTIGRFNLVSFDLQLSTLGIITGNLQIKGLPANAIAIAAGSVGIYSNLNTAYVGLGLVMQSGNSVIDVTGLAAASVASGISLTQANITATTRISGQIAYMS